MALLVSILIPVYNSRFFESALVSALNQTYPHTEIIIGDDSDNDNAAQVVKKYPDPKVRYIRNPARLGFHGNFAHCFEEARGVYIKFLNHDDLLHPQCVATMVKAFEVGGESIRLVTSQRLIIDSQGTLKGEKPVTAPLSAQNSMMSGLYLGDVALTRGMNVIGEPTTPMFRRADVSLIEGTLFRIFDRSYLCLADLCLWLRLLTSGKAVYLAQALSYFREHDAQLQSTPESAARCIVERLYLPIDARKIGFLQSDSSYQTATGHAIRLIREYQSMPGTSAVDQALYAEALDVANAYQITG